MKTKKKTAIMTSRVGHRQRNRDKPVRRRSTSSHQFGVCSVTARKLNSNDKLGVQLREEDGKYIVSKIFSDGIFAESSLRVGDSVLSVNGESIRDLFLDELVELAERAEDKVTFVVRQQTAEKKRRKEEKKDDSSERLLSNEIIANKHGKREDAGIRFMVKEKKLFISEIRRDSIFYDTKLRVGHCVTKINEMEFIEYADANYALMIANKKGSKRVILRVLQKQQ